MIGYPPGIFFPLNIILCYLRTCGWYFAVLWHCGSLLCCVCTFQEWFTLLRVPAYIHAAHLALTRARRAAPRTQRAADTYPLPTAYLIYHQLYVPCCFPSAPTLLTSHVPHTILLLLYAGTGFSSILLTTHPHVLQLVFQTWDCSYFFIHFTCHIVLFLWFGPFEICPFNICLPCACLAFAHHIYPPHNHLPCLGRHLPLTRTQPFGAAII